jgi:hypothetical protein
LTQEGSYYLESLGIKDHVLAWKESFDAIFEELESKDEDDESIYIFKLILE